MLFVPSVDPLAKFLLNPMVEKRYFAVSVLKIMVVVRERLVLGILDGHRCMTNVAPDLALQIDRCSEPPAISVVKVARSPFGRLMVNQSFVATVLPRPKPIPEGRLVTSDQCQAGQDIKAFAATCSQRSVYRDNGQNTRRD